MTGTEVDQWQQAYNALAPAARERWELPEVQTIRRAIMPDLRAEEFQLVMAMAARYDLDPMAHEIWGTRGNPQDGSPGKLLIMVGRDGLLKVARRDPLYMGFDGDVIREKDTFKVKRSAEGREIIHEYEGDADARGEITGSWAQVYIQGKHDVYFYAPVKEYMPQSHGGGKPGPHPRSSWYTNPSAMMAKCSLSLALRLAFNLSGVVAEEEMGQVLEGTTAEQDVIESGEALTDVVADIPEDLRDRFYAAFGEAAELRPGQMRPAAVRMSVRSQPRKAIETYLDAMEQANAAAREKAFADGQREQENREALVEKLQNQLAELSAQRERATEDREQAELDEQIELVEAELRATGAVPVTEAEVVS